MVQVAFVVGSRLARAVPALLLLGGTNCARLTDDCRETKTCALPPGSCLVVRSEDPLEVEVHECPEGAPCPADCTDLYGGRDGGAVDGGPAQDARADATDAPPRPDSAEVDARAYSAGSEPDTDHGLFVSASGDDQGADAGTSPSHPFKTIGAAIAAVPKAGATRTKIYVCDDVSSLYPPRTSAEGGARDGAPPADASGPADGSASAGDASSEGEGLASAKVTVEMLAGDSSAGDAQADETGSDGAADAVAGVVIDLDEHPVTELRGGYDCSRSTWVAPAADSGAEGRKTVVAPARDVPLVIKRSAATHDSALVVSDFTFDAADAAEPGGSSVAASVVNSAVKFERVSLIARDASDGATPAYTSNYFMGDPSGTGANGPLGGTAQRCECPDNVALDPPGGGAGGDSSSAPASNGYARNGDPGYPMYSDNHGAAGSSTSSCSGGQVGMSGARGPDGQGAQTWGSLDDQGVWLPTSGSPGGTGTPGQGGGGGGGGYTSDTTKGGGGGGGCGGCGGRGGPGGQAGGSSIALLSKQSIVELEHAVLIAGRAGNGADGAQGEDGQGGGQGGKQSAPGCPGGAGGNGGPGGAGGGGAGGISAAIAYSIGADASSEDDAAALLDGGAGNTFSVGQPGHGGNSSAGSPRPSVTDGGVDRGGKPGTSGELVRLDP